MPKFGTSSQGDIHFHPKKSRKVLLIANNGPGGFVWGRGCWEALAERGRFQGDYQHRLKACSAASVALAWLEKQLLQGMTSTKCLPWCRARCQVSRCLLCGHACHDAWSLSCCSGSVHPQCLLQATKASANPLQIASLSLATWGVQACPW